MRITASPDHPRTRVADDPAERSQWSSVDRDSLADLLRREVHARAWTPRASVVERMHRTLLPIAPVEVDAIAATCRELVRSGDLVLAEGGCLAATPLRVVPTTPERWRIFASAPSDVLDAVLPGEWASHGLRRIRIAAGDAIENAVAAVDGRLVRPDEWSGMNRTPAADAAFVEMLDRGLASHAEAAGSLDADGPMEWRAWVPHEGRFVWRTSNEGRLWRARHPRLGWRRAWTKGESPSAKPFLGLGSDEAARAAFAVARTAQAPLALRIEEDGSSSAVLLSIDGWLPLAEYRYLTLHGELVDGAAWRIDGAARDDVTACLMRRLGLAIATA